MMWPHFYSFFYIKVMRFLVRNCDIIWAKMLNLSPLSFHLMKWNKIDYHFYYFSEFSCRNISSFINVTCNIFYSFFNHLQFCTSGWSTVRASHVKTYCWHFLIFHEFYKPNNWFYHVQHKGTILIWTFALLIYTFMLVMSLE